MKAVLSKKAWNRQALRGNGVGDLGRLIIAKSEFLQR
jgi:hypothetical protein